MGTPAWLYYLFGMMMLAVAAYCLALLVLSVPMHQSTGRDVDIAHLLMGVSMGGMFVGRWAFGPSGIWELIFGALLVWFVVRSLQSVQRYGLHIPHEAIHAAMSFAMLLMYWYPPTSTSTSTAMSMGASSTGAKLDPGLGLILAMLFFGSAIFTLASPNKGASHHGTHVPAFVGGSPDGSRALEGTGGGQATSVGTFESVLTAPWLEDVSHVVMCVGMGFLLILMM